MEHTYHNPDQYMFGFRQLATNGRKKIGILVGAGAPVSINTTPEKGWTPLIPNICGLEKIITSSLPPEQREVYQKIKDSIPESNLETVLSRVRMLADVVGEGEIFGCNSERFSALSVAICEKIREVVSAELPGGVNPYSELVSWINGISRRYAVEIFTTNYDLLMEQALERAKTPYFDGFSGAKSAFSIRQAYPRMISRRDGLGSGSSMAL